MAIVREVIVWNASNCQEAATAVVSRGADIWSAISERHRGRSLLTRLAGRNACPTAMGELDYNSAASRGRQQRLLAEMQKLKLDLVVVQQTEHVQYLTGAR